MRWLDQRFEPLIAQIPPALHSKLEAAEIFHQLLEHRWFLSESADADISLEDALASYIADVLADAPDELLSLGEVTAELPIIVADPSPTDPRSSEPGPLRTSDPEALTRSSDSRLGSTSHRCAVPATLSGHERNPEHRRT